MKILLVYTNTNRDLSPLPSGIAYLVPNLKKNGHQICILDLMYSSDPCGKLDEKIKDFKPYAVGFSIRNLDNHSMLFPDDPLPKIREYIMLAKNNGIKTIIGGMAFTTVPEKMLEYLEADFGIAGQGEDSLPLLLDMIENKTFNPMIPGLVWKDKGKIYSNEIDKSGYCRKHPDWSMINIKKYKTSLFPASTVIKTGCEFSCLYCDSCKSAGFNMIARDIDSIIKDIRDVIKTLGIRLIYFADPCLPNPINFAKDLFKAIINEKLNIHISANLEPAHGCYDEELFELYKKAGGIFTILGCESFSPTMLRNYRKPFTLNDVLKWSKLAKKAGVKFAIQLLFGGPGENTSTVKETVKALQEIDFTLFLYGIGIRIYPKTGLFEIAKKQGFIQSEDELLFSKFYLSREVDLEWLKNYLRGIDKKYSIKKAGMLPILGKMMMSKYFKIKI